MISKPLLRTIASATSMTTGVFLLATVRTLAQNHDTDVDNSRTNTSLIVADIRPKLFGDLSPSERQIYNQIEFSISSEDKIMNAYATRKGGVRRVVLTEAIGRATELNTDAFLMEQLYHKPGFLGNYMSFVCEQYQKNYRRYAQGLPASRIPSPYEFAHWSDNDLNQFYADRDANRVRTAALGAAFSFLLAHEVAHHVKGHVDHPTSDLAERRDQETEADSWAIDLMTRKQLNPVDGIIPLLFFYFTDQNPVSNEAQSDHPADIRRLLGMYEGLSERLPSFKPYLLGQNYDATRKRIDLSISLVKQEIEAGEKGRSARQGASQSAREGRSFAGEARSGLCDDLSSYASAAATNFSLLRGAADPDGGGEAFYAKRGVEGFTDCTVWIYRDRSIEPSSSCDASGGNLESLRGSIQACLGSDWSFKTRRGDYIFQGPRGVVIRLHGKDSGKVELWVDSPSRE